MCNDKNEVFEMHAGP